MQTAGNLDYLKKEIKKIYAGKLDAYKTELEKAKKEELKNIDTIHKKEVRDAKDSLEKNEQSEYKTTLSEEMLGAKKDFESAREKLINDVFVQAEKRCGETLTSENYINHIKVYDKDNAKIIGSETIYKDTFPNIELNKKQKGIIVEKENHVFDFTFDTFLESRKLDLRYKVSQVLFKHVN